MRGNLEMEGEIQALRCQGNKEEIAEGFVGEFARRTVEEILKREEVGWKMS